MAIETIKKVTIVSPRGSDKRLMKTLGSLGVMEVIDLGDIQEGEGPSLQRTETSTEETDEKLHQIDFILNLINLFSPEKQSFVEGLAPVPLVTSQQELHSVIEQYDLEKQYKVSGELDERYRSSERVIGEIENELRELDPLSDLPFDIADFYRPVMTGLVFGNLPLKNLPLLDESIEPWNRTAWEEIKPETLSKLNTKPTGGTASSSEQGEERARVVVAFLAEESEAIHKALASVGFEEIHLPKLSEKISERIDELRSDLAEYKQKVDDVAEEVRRFAQGQQVSEGRRPLLILRAHWQNIKNTQLASTKGFQGKWVHVMGGYIRQKDTEKFLATLGQESPDSEITIQDPGPDDDVPVSIEVPSLFRPIRLLVEMFGLPPYKAFDPTPFLQVNFFLFFGICFSDVCYGIMLTALGAYLSAKTRPFRGVNDFSRILLYGGISSIIFGAILGSWFGDLYKPEYLGKGNFLLRLQEMFVVLDPIDKTIVALLCALGIGICNQFYGIILKMYGALRNRDFLGAFSDGVCWIVTLTGLLMMVGKIFTEIPAAIFNTGFWLFVFGALGLVLTQGRDFKNPFAQAGRRPGEPLRHHGQLWHHGLHRRHALLLPSAGAWPDDFNRGHDLQPHCRHAQGGALCRVHPLSDRACGWASV